MSDSSILGNMLEAQFVASLIRQPVLAKALTLEPGHFLHPRTAALYRALRSITVDVTPLTLLDEAQRLGVSIDADFLAAIMDLDADLHTIEEFQERALRIQETFLRYDAKRRIGSLLTQFTDPTIPLQDVLAGVNEVILSTSRDAVGKETPTAPEIIHKAHTRETGASFSSGLRHIDEATTAQGLRKRQLVALAAPYGTYKTALTVNIVNDLLQQGRSVAYLPFEDDAVAFTEVLTSIHSGVPLFMVEDLHEKKVKPSKPEYAKALEDAERWLVEDVAERWRVYDAGAFPIYTWKLLPSILAADKVQYGTDLVVIDFLQAISEDFQEMSQLMKLFMRVAQELDVCVLLLNQMSNQTLREGSTSNLFAAKGSGSVGAMVHLGIELKHDADTGRVPITANLLKEINETGIPNFLSMSARKDASGRPMPSVVAELLLATKKIRRGSRSTSCVLIDPLSGKVVLQYGSPRFTSVTKGSI